MKTSLYRRIEILYFLAPRDFKMFHITSNYFCIFNNTPLARWVAHTTRDFLICYSCSYYRFMLIRKTFPEILAFSWFLFEVIGINNLRYMPMVTFKITMSELFSYASHASKRRIRTWNMTLISNFKTFNDAMDFSCSNRYFPQSA